MTPVDRYAAVESYSEEDASLDFSGCALQKTIEGTCLLGGLRDRHEGLESGA